MLVVSYLSQQFLPRLVDTVRDIGADHVHAASWDEVEDLIHRRPVSVLVIDPYADRASRTDDIVALLQQFPSTPIIVYTEFTPTALRVLTVLAQYGLQETLLFQIDDDCARLGRLLTRLGTLPLVLRILQELRHERSQLIPPLADAVDDLFKRPYAYTSGRDLVLASQTPLTSLYRALMEAGFAPPKQLFIAARVLHAVVYVRDPGTTVQQVAEKIGYQHARVLTQHTLAVFGLRPSALRHIPDDDALPPLLRWTRLKSPNVDTVHATLPSHQIDVESDAPDTRSIDDRATDQPLVTVPDTDSAAVWGTLLGYGEFLESTDCWAKAAYLYKIILVALGLPEACVDPVPAAVALQRFGFALRFLGHLETSYTAYQRSRAIAEQNNIMPLAVRACIGMANTLMKQGNLGDAETLLSHAVADASTFGIVTLESNARHSRGAVRSRRGQYVDAMTDFFDAYALTDDVFERELIVGDIAATAGDAGYRTMASNAYRVLMRTTRIPITQAGALINLLEFAVYDGDATEFERLQGQIKTHASMHSLPIDYVLHVALYTAYGTERFSTREAAITAYETLIVQARGLGSHQIAFKAEERLAALTAGAVPPVDPPTHTPPDSLHNLMNTIAEWDTLASHTT